VSTAPADYHPTRFRPTQCRHPVRIAWVAAGPALTDRRLGTISTRCKSWGCAGCGRRLRQLHGQLIELAFRDHQARGDTIARFITVTWPTDVGALLASAADCANTSLMFRRWVQAVRRQYGRLDYYVVKEPTRRGRLHLHAVAFGVYLHKCRRNLPGGCVLGHGAECSNPCHRAAGCLAEPGRRPCVQELAHRAGLGWLDIRMVRGEHHAAAYVGKYLGKDHIGHRWPRHSRRASYSRRFAPTTIGVLGAAWSARAFELGVAAGHLTPRPPPPAGWETSWHLLSELMRRGPPVAVIGWLPGRPRWELDLEHGTARHLGTDLRADLDTGEVLAKPWLELTELGWLRRMDCRLEAEAAAIAGGPDWQTELTDPLTRRLVYAAARRRAFTEAGMAPALR